MSKKESSSVSVRECITEQVYLRDVPENLIAKFVYSSEVVRKQNARKSLCSLCGNPFDDFSQSEPIQYLEMDLHLNCYISILDCEADEG